MPSAAGYSAVFQGAIMCSSTHLHYVKDLLNNYAYPV
jgi:hypothetical protein